ncbi:hypothetical protein DFAR_3370015 [Desulfarculales bacterium]
MLRWIKKATSVRATQWRITHVTHHALKCIAPDTKTLAPALKALMILEEHAHLILTSWASNHYNARLERLNGILQATRARVRGYLPCSPWQKVADDAKVEDGYPLFLVLVHVGPP